MVWGTLAHTRGKDIHDVVSSCHCLHSLEHAHPMSASTSSEVAPLVWTMNPSFVISLDARGTWNLATLRPFSCAPAEQ
jgi:hypothetical protein